MVIRGVAVDGFLIGLAVVVSAAIVFPAPGASHGILHMDLIATYGVAIVFFLYGLTLAPEKLHEGATNWRVHLIVQLATFVLFPVVVLALLFAFGWTLPAPTSTGFFYIAALPSTVSSSVAMTSIARGNVPAAIFNATLSSLIGVFATPILMAWFAATTGETMALLPVIAKVVGLVLVPIAVGQVARHWLRNWAARHIKTIRLADRAIILAIVYNSFSDSMVEGIWGGHDLSFLIAMIAGVILLFAVVYWIIMIPCRLFGFNRADTIASLFCGSKKSLATGVPLARLMFSNSPALGLIIAPIMLYHFFQHVIVGDIANRYARAPA
jgi:sodium/bile acid cotransporter 7